MCVMAFRTDTAYGYEGLRVKHAYQNKSLVVKWVEDILPLTLELIWPYL